MASTGNEHGGGPERGPGGGGASDPAPPVELSSFAADLREGWRSEQEQFAGEAEVAWRHRQSLSDVLAAHRHRGDILAVQVLGRIFTGPVVGVGADLLALHTSDGRVDIRTASRPDRASTRTPLAVRLVQQGKRGAGRASADSDEGFRARLLELEAGRGDVAVGAVGLGEEPVGTVALGADHLGVGGGSNILLPLAAVAYVRAVDQPF